MPDLWEVPHVRAMMRGAVLLVVFLLTGCGLIVAPWRERQCRNEGGVPYSSYRMFGQYEGTQCYASDPLAPGGAKQLWSK